MGQDKIVLQKDILKAGLDLLRVWIDSAPGHQETLKPTSGGFFIWSGGDESINLAYAAILDLVEMRFPFRSFFSTSLIDLDSFLISPSTKLIKVCHPSPLDL